MSLRYCVHLFPTFTNLSQIDQFRQRFDPLATKIQPHVTLVFPLKIEPEKLPFVIAHVQAIAQDFASFIITLGTPVAENDFVLLPVEEGRDTVHQLHDGLYTGLLAPFLRHDLPYVPHCTIGRTLGERLPEACEAFGILRGPFMTTVEEVVIEAFDEDDVSQIMARVMLANFTLATESAK